MSTQKLIDGWTLAAIIAVLTIIGLDVAACLIYFEVWTP